MFFSWAPNKSSHFFQSLYLPNLPCPDLPCPVAPNRPAVTSAPSGVDAAKHPEVLARYINDHVPWTEGTEGTGDERRPVTPVYHKWVYGLYFSMPTRVPQQ